MASLTHADLPSEDEEDDDYEIDYADADREDRPVGGVPKRKPKRK